MDPVQNHLCSALCLGQQPGLWHLLCLFKYFSSKYLFRYTEPGRMKCKHHNSLDLEAGESETPGWLYSITQIIIRAICLKQRGFRLHAIWTYVMDESHMGPKGLSWAIKIPSLAPCHLSSSRKQLEAIRYKKSYPNLFEKWICHSGNNL